MGDCSGKTVDKRLAYKLRQAEKGLCIQCPETAIHLHKCRKHWLLEKATKRRYRERLSQKRRDEGLCLNCGVTLDPDSDGGVVCINCGCQTRLRHERGRNLR
jgi:predicted RNA-binding Zn-ribbon protein involved in translation (DUF1610 family)